MSEPRSARARANIYAYRLRAFVLPSLLLLCLLSLIFEPQRFASAQQRKGVAPDAAHAAKRTPTGETDAHASSQPQHLKLAPDGLTPAAPRDPGATATTPRKSKNDADRRATAGSGDADSGDSESGKKVRRVRRSATRRSKPRSLIRRRPLSACRIARVSARPSPTGSRHVRHPAQVHEQDGRERHAPALPHRGHHHSPAPEQRDG